MDPSAHPAARLTGSLPARVDVYDLDKDGAGPLVTRQGFLAQQSGPVTLDLWSADWRLAAGISLPRSTAITPGMASAALVSMEVTFACACGLRRIAA